MQNVAIDDFDAADRTPVVIQDGRVCNAGELQAAADRAAARLMRFRGGRLALATRRVDTVVTAIRACQAVGCDLLLLREAPAPGAPAWNMWQVTGMLDDDLVATPLDNASPAVAEAGILLPTSGTTGLPKIVRHHPEILLAKPSGSAPRQRRRALIAFHPVSFSGLKVILGAIATGMELIALSEQTLPRLADAAVSHAAQEFKGTPTIMRSLWCARCGGAEDDAGGCGNSRRSAV